MKNTTLNILNQYKELIVKTKPINHVLLRDIYEAIDREFEDEKDSIIDSLKYNLAEKDLIIKKIINGIVDQEMMGGMNNYGK